MLYLWIEGLVALGLLSLLPLVLGASRSASRLRGAREAVSEDLKERTGLLRARVAGIRVAIAEWRHRATE